MFFIYSSPDQNFPDNIFIFYFLGKNESELPEARRGYTQAQSVDNHPWIWRDLRNLGYVTQWGEDGASTGTFTYRMLGN